MLILQHLRCASSPHDLALNRAMLKAKDQWCEYAALTMAGERQVISPGLVCPDHRACRRLAFARYLYLTGRISDDDDG